MPATGRPAAVRQLARRTRELFLLCAVTGALAGAAVLAFEVVASAGADAVLDRGSPLLLVLLPPLALVPVRWLTARHAAGAATTDDYIRAFHAPGSAVDLGPAPARVGAALLTLGAALPLGFEGPAVYLGSVVGSALQRLRRFIGESDASLLLVAGAAAGVAAVFRAPATGAVFALEVPFVDDLARRRLLPALIGAASGYLAFVAGAGTERLIPVAGAPDLFGRDLLAALAVGVVCGLGARAYATLLRAAKGAAARVRPLVAVPAAGAVLAASVLVAERALGDGGLALGAGYRVLDWSLVDGRTLGALVLVATLRVAATSATVGGGGVGGLFVPLVLQGALTGAGMSAALGERGTLLPVVGIAAFLGAGYRVPLAAVMFVAETTGRPGFVVPGLLASVAAQLVGGRAAGVSPYQRETRSGHLEHRLDLPVTQALEPDTATVRLGTTLAEHVAEHVAAARRRAVPAVDAEGRYAGLVELETVLEQDRSRWQELLVDDVLRDGPTVSAAADVGEAVSVLAARGVDRVVVVDGQGRPLGTVTMAAVLDLEQVLDALERRRST